MAATYPPTARGSLFQTGTTAELGVHAFAGLAGAQQQVRRGIRLARTFRELAPEFLRTGLASVESQHVPRDGAQPLAARQLATRVGRHPLQHLRAREWRRVGC